MNFSSITLFVILIISQVSFAQDTTYYNQNDLRIKTIDNAEYFIIKTKVGFGAIEQGFFATGEKKSEKEYTYKFKKLVNIDTTKEWYINGKIHWLVVYKEGKLNGELTSYWGNGQLKRKDVFEMDSLMNGTCYNKDGEKVEYYPFEVQPEFKGGASKMYEWLGENIVYPNTAREAGIQGKVYVKFDIDKNGNLINKKIVRGVHITLDKEVIRILKISPKWTPGVKDGEKATYSFTLPVNFRITSAKETRRLKKEQKKKEKQERKNN